MLAAEGVFCKKKRVLHTKRTTSLDPLRKALKRPRFGAQFAQAPIEFIDDAGRYSDTLHNVYLIKLYFPK